MTVQVYAHRGSSNRFAEHTRAAYLQAVADGADGVECDLHLSADGELVLLHDDTVERTSNGVGAVAQLTLSQLRALDFTSWKGADIPKSYGGVAQQLLTLGELLDILSGAGRDIGLAIEFKYGELFDAEVVDATLLVLSSRGWTPEESVAGNVHISFMSFHPDAVRYLAQQIPSQHLCQLLEVAEIAGLRATTEGEKLLDAGVAHLAGPGVEYLRANPENAARWRSAGRLLRVWTVDTEADLALCLAAGVEEVTTNRPEHIKALLGSEDS